MRACAHVPSSHGQPFARAHFSTSRWPPNAAYEHVFASHGQLAALRRSALARPLQRRRVRARRRVPRACSHLGGRRTPPQSPPVVLARPSVSRGGRPRGARVVSSPRAVRSPRRVPARSRAPTSVWCPTDDPSRFVLARPCPEVHGAQVHPLRAVRSPRQLTACPTDDPASSSRCSSIITVRPVAATASLILRETAETRARSVGSDNLSRTCATNRWPEGRNRRARRVGCDRAACRSIGAGGHRRWSRVRTCGSLWRFRRRGSRT